MERGLVVVRAFLVTGQERAGSISNVASEGAHDGSWNNRSAMDYRIQFDFQKGRALEMLLKSNFSMNCK